MSHDLGKFIRDSRFESKVVSAEEAASYIEDGMILGMSGFTLFGEPKEFPLALSERGKKENFKVNVYTGASIGQTADQSMAEAELVNLREHCQDKPVIRNKINAGEMFYIDQHL